VVAARNLPDAVVGAPARSRPSPVLDRLEALAVEWAAVGQAAEPTTAGRLATLLRRLAATLRAEPFWAFTAREIGADILASGLCGPPDAPAADIEDVLAPSLGLLRRNAAAFGLAGADGERRLAATLDELAVGFARGLRERHRLPPRRTGAGLAPGDRERLDRAVVTQAPVGIGLADLAGQVLDMNPALCRLFGLDAPLSEPRPFTDFVHPDDVADLVDRFRRLVDDAPRPPGTDVMRAEMRFVRPDGLVLWTRMVASLLRDEDGAPSRVMAFIENLAADAARHPLPFRLQPASYQDQLTKLPNRSLTEEWLQRAFGPGGSRRVGLCALDVDAFAPINDGLGHQVGDQLLLAVAGRLQLAAGKHLVTRIGGDEFAVLVAEPEDVNAVCRVADRALSALTTPFLVGGHSMTVTASIGVAETPTALGCPEELMRAAAVALSWAKAHGGARRMVFDPQRDAGESARFALLAGLRGGIDRGEMRLAFQPLVRLVDGHVQGAEALVRWQHPVEGLIGPGRFIELAEQSGSIVPLGRWVLEEACAQAATWWRASADTPWPPSPYVSVNVSPVQLAEAGWVQEVTGILEGTGLPPHRLQLEITEQAVMREEAVALDALTALRDAGVRLALDDFGTGYSSLAWLRRLPVQALKIDGSFIDGLRYAAADPVDASIVRALVQMAHALGLEVTAEWVETGVQARRLSELGCDLGQGRWFGDAGPAAWVPGRWRRSLGT
jgi:diguanylate cyclase (GGDEF)-like protein/PAS domain S-box-containing protein